MVVGTSVVLLAFGGGAALANGSHGPTSSNSATQGATSAQLLPIAAGVGAAAPVNANLPVGLLSGGPAGGPLSQEAHADARGTAANNSTAQSVRQGGGGDAAGSSAPAVKLLPVGGKAPAPVVGQAARARAAGTAKNNSTAQSVRQDSGGGAGKNAAAQSASNAQVVPVALGAAAAAPVNANLPVGLLALGPRQGAVRQRADADADAQALNNDAAQEIRQEGGQGTGKGGQNAASQRASNSQLLPIALGAALGIPVNANVPVALLSAGPLQGDVDQEASARVRARAANNALAQSVRQEGGQGGQNTASQSGSNSQVLPLSLGAALGIPINANVPISILSAGPVQGAVRQRADADAAAEALNNATVQSVRQQGAGGGQNAATQGASNSQVLPIALGPAVALPINLNLPISILSAGPIQGEVTQAGSASAIGRARTNDLVQSVEQAGAGHNSVGQTASSQQILPVALGPSVATPLNINLPIAVLSDGQFLGIGGMDVLTAVPSLLTDPFGTTSSALGTLGNPVGAVTGLLAGL
jgi:hypothetical protein